MSTYFSAGFIKILHDFNVCYLLSETYFTHVAVNYSFTMFDFKSRASGIICLKSMKQLVLDGTRRVPVYEYVNQLDTQTQVK